MAHLAETSIFLRFWKGKGTLIFLQTNAATRWHDGKIFMNFKWKYSNFKLFCFSQQTPCMYLETLPPDPRVHLTLVLMRDT